MFIFGFTIERKDTSGHRIYSNKFENPIKNKYKELWTEEIWHQTRRGSPNDYPVENEYEEYFPLEGILFMLKQIDNIRLLGLPDWTYFYILGEGLGRYNSNEIKLSEFEYFLSKLPSEFIEKYYDIINCLINDFIEKEFTFNLIHDDRNFVFYFSAKEK
jgi:hypothetical protein